MTRRTWVYRDNGKGGVDAIEVGADFVATPSTTTDGLKFQIETLVGMNGERFGSRGAFDRYLSKNDLALHSDTVNHVAKLQAERAKAFTPGAGFDAKSRREDVGRALYQLKEKSRK